MSIDLQLSVLACNGRSMIIDLTEVTSLSSLGIHGILMSAKAILLRDRRMALLSPNEHVADVLTTAGIDKLALIYDDLDAARVAVTPG